MPSAKSRSSKNGNALSWKEKKQVTSIVRKVTSQQAEHKDHLYSYASFDILNPSAVGGGSPLLCLSNVPTGDDNYQRVGLKIKPTRLQFRYKLAGGDDFNVVRVIIFMFMNSDFGNTPTYETILQNLTPNATLQPYRRGGKYKYKILYDTTHVLVKDTFNYHITRNANMFAKDWNHKDIMYSEAGSTSGTNNIWLAVLSDSNFTTHPKISFVSRLNYRDF